MRKGRKKESWQDGLTRFGSVYSFPHPVSDVVGRSSGKGIMLKGKPIGGDIKKFIEREIAAAVRLAVDSAHPRLENGV